MLPNRKSSPAPRPRGVVAEVRVPDDGMSFVAMVSSLREDSVLLWTVQQLEPGTPVVVAIDLPGGRTLVDGQVAESFVKNGLAIDLDAIDEDARARIEAISVSALRVA